VLGLDAEEFEHLPEVFMAFVRYTHGRRRVQLELTTETVEAVERWRHEFLRLMELAAADSEEDDFEDEPDEPA